MQKKMREKRRKILTAMHVFTHKSFSHTKVMKKKTIHIIELHNFIIIIFFYLLGFLVRLQLSAPSSPKFGKFSTHTCMY